MYHEIDWIMDTDSQIRSRSSPSTEAKTNTEEQTPLLSNIEIPRIRYWDDRIEDEDVCSWEGGSISTIEGSIQEHKNIHVGMRNLVSQKYESLDYDICENVVFLEEQRKKLPKFRAIRRPFLCLCQLADSVAFVDFQRWVAIFIIGVLTGATACIITISIEMLSDLKFSFIKKLIYHTTDYQFLVKPYGYWLLFSAVSVAFGSLLVTFVAPVAAGSGIPVIKCYLNGVKVPQVVRFKTLIVKAVGVVSSVVGGLAVGKEGPMIHCGAVIAAGVSQGKSTTFRRDCKVFEKFREDHEKRDFVSAGAAAGVAAAFGAPVGGVLFSLEEGASFWNQALTLRIFFCSMVSFFTLNTILSIYYNQPFRLTSSKLLKFGKFENLDYGIVELFMYLIMGVIGGLLGALYNHLNFKLTVFRMRYVKHPVAKVVEAVLVCLVGVTIAFLTSMLSSDCQNVPDEFIRPTDYETPLQLKCGDGEYSTFGAVWFETPEACLKRLFHGSLDNWQTLMMFFVCYYLLGCWTYGLSISSGLFIPTLVIGAAWGRLFGTFMILYFRPYVNTLCLAKFAVIGAAAMLGGVVRMTISLTVILMEAIGNITFGLPIMICVMIAKWIGDCFNEGLYDIHIQLASVPILVSEPPYNSYHIYASKVMSAPVVYLKTIENVGKIIHILKTETHNGFPVVDCTDESCDGLERFGVFRGLILRWQLIVLLQHKMFNETAELSWRSQKLSLQDFRDSYPRHPSIHALHISPQEETYSLDLRPYINRSAYTISSNASLPRIFRLFRALGLRHLPVVDDRNNVVGMITRKDIARFRTKHYDDLEELIISVG